ncbi:MULTISPECIES: toxin-antitoxin system HicB family antitoxin [unclassified Amycolatopsis]|uniref:toxin-antitoxin system HicB family antitoxin n=1 Tax=unclassified Amycolatopsis TaxID=2618356 RepID=UPI00287649C3|nr:MULTISPECIES: toxin-antitoxin system HicB family antitoxin [unclassified Amycolatopsis]MDS0136602.1 toxin-antitoxin system HicB family antitoxin [Amycolatopsis sp. 505]MDS0143266.1 toxin-antitoxin system HicB family antitoxin [Amycolatopsis sp. CM201R]
MDLTPYIANLREDLANTAAAGDEQTRRAAALLSSALEPAVRLTLMNALADLAAEVTAALPGQVVDVRLDGRDVRVVVTGDAEGTTSRETPRDTTPPPPPIDGGDISRITLRLVEQIKGQAERAAAAQGVSLNTFVSQAVQGALGHGALGGGGGSRKHQGKSGGSGSHLHGWVEG